MMKQFLSIFSLIKATEPLRMKFPKNPTHPSSNAKDKDVSKNLSKDGYLNISFDESKTHYFLGALRVCVLPKSEVDQITGRSLIISQPIDMVLTDTPGKFFKSFPFSFDFTKKVEEKLLNGSDNLTLDEFLKEKVFEHSFFKKYFPQNIGASGKGIEGKWDEIISHVLNDSSNKEKLESEKKELLKRGFINRCCFPFSDFNFNVNQSFIKLIKNAKGCSISFKEGDLVFIEFNAISLNKSNYQLKSHCFSYQVYSSHLYEYKGVLNKNLVLHSTNEQQLELIKTAIKKVKEQKPEDEEEEEDSVVFTWFKRFVIVAGSSTIIICVGIFIYKYYKKRAQRRDVSG